MHGVLIYEISEPELFMTIYYTMYKMQSFIDTGQTLTNVEQIETCNVVCVVM